MDARLAVTRSHGRRAPRVPRRTAASRTLVKSTDGAIGYVDLADAANADLVYASIKNADGKFVGADARRRGSRHRRARPSTRI